MYEAMYGHDKYKLSTFKTKSKNFEHLRVKIITFNIKK